MGQGVGIMEQLRRHDKQTMGNAVERGVAVGKAELWLGRSGGGGR